MGSRSFSTLCPKITYVRVDISGMIKKETVQCALKTTSTLQPLTAKTKIKSVPYLPPFTNNIAKILPSHNMKPAYLQLGRLLSNGKDTTPIHPKSGVYLLKCRDCPSLYVGECGRAFYTRLTDLKTKIPRNLRSLAICC